MKKLFLVIGAPGSGKTTDAQIIAEHNEEIKHYSTGELLRTEVASGSELGVKIDSFISKGELVPLEIVVNTIVNAIKTCHKDIVIIDGYPRSVEQMKALDDVLSKENSVKLISVLEARVSEEVAKERVLGRARGADDNVEVFDNRMKIYNAPLKEIQDFYSKLGLLKIINAERSIEEIVSDMEKHIKSKI